MNEILKYRKKMVEYQKSKNIKKMCMTNVQILFDIIKSSDTNLNTIVKPKIVIGAFNEDTLKIIKAHLVINIDNHIIDTSYEVMLLNNKYYFDNIKQFYDHIQKYKITQNFRFNHEEIQTFINFQKIAKDINKGLFCISNKEYYNNLYNNLLNTL
mgnify:CR=1 FL=1